MSGQGQGCGELFTSWIGNRNTWYRSRILLCAALNVLLAAVTVGLTGEARAQLVVVPSLEVEASVPTDFFVRVGGSEDSLPSQSYMLISDLPASVKLSVGKKTEAGSWAVPFSALEQLKLTAPASLPARSEFNIALVAGDGRVIEKRTVALYVGPEAPIALVERKVNTSSARETPAPATPVAPAPIVFDQKSVTSSPADRAQAARLFGRGQQSLARGDIQEARLLFRRAADLGLPIAAMKLAETHDSIELGRHTIHGPKPDPAEARKWYQRALELGLVEAEARLRRLSTR
jgi:Sel1 repeat